MPIIVIWCVGKKWLFWFFERWLVYRQKPKVLFCAADFFTLSDNKRLK